MAFFFSIFFIHYHQNLMLIYTLKLDEYVKRHVLPKILLDPTNFYFQSISKPYVTCYNVANKCSKRSSNLQNILQKRNLGSDIILIFVKCGNKILYDLPCDYFDYFDYEEIVLKYYVNIKKHWVEFNVIVNGNNCIYSILHTNLKSQILSNIEKYHMLLYIKRLDIRSARYIVIDVLRDANRIFYCKDIGNLKDMINKIKEIAIDCHPDIKILKWGIVLQEMSKLLQ